MRRIAYLVCSVVTISPPFSAVLLAGGESRRMGRDKAALQIDGEPLWQRQLATLRASGAGETFIAGRTGGPYCTGESDAPVVFDELPGCGPLGAIATALRHARHDWLLVLAVDMPAMTADFLRSLAAQAAEAGRGLIPVLAGQPEPLAAIYPRAALAHAQRQLGTGDFTLRAWIAKLAACSLLMPRHVITHEEPLFKNLNTPGDFA